MLVAGEVARQTGIDFTSTRGCPHSVFDELFAGFDAQQSLLVGNIIADADDDLVEDSQGIVQRVPDGSG